MTRTNLDLNILPDTYRRRLLSRRQALLLTAMALATTLALIAYLAAGSAVAETSRLSDEGRLLDLQIQAIQARQQKLVQLKADIARYGAIPRQRGTISWAAQTATAQAVADDVRLTHISINRERIILTGSTTRANAVESRDATFAFVAGLRSRQGLAATELTSIASPSPGSPSVNFIINIPLQAA